MTTHDEYTKQCTSWAAQVITQNGGTLHPLPIGWDVEMRDGSWRAANTWQELSAVANECLANRSV